MGSGISCSSKTQTRVSDSIDSKKDIKVDTMKRTSNSKPIEVMAEEYAGLSNSYNNQINIDDESKDVEQEKSSKNKDVVQERSSKGMDAEQERSSKDMDAEQERSSKDKEAEQFVEQLEETQVKEKEAPVKKEPLTAEELANFKKEMFTTLREKCEKALACDPRKNEDGEFDVKIRNAVLKLGQSYFGLKKEREPREEISKYREELANMILETKVLDLLYEIVEWTYKNGWHSDDMQKQTTKYLPLSHSMLTLLNFSDASATFATELASQYNLPQLMKTIIVDYTGRHLGTVEPKLRTTEMSVLKWSMSIVHNMSMVESNKNALRDIGMIETLQPLLQSQNEIISISALASLAGIINEKECEIINGNKVIVMNLLDMLKKGQKKKDRRHLGWSCKECTYTVRKLAKNDANKKLLVDLGALELLVDMGKKGNLEEQLESVEAIWALSFDEDNQALITGNQDLGVIELLVNLKKSEDIEIKRACNGALWTLKDALKTTVVEKYKLIGEELANKRHIPAPKMKNKSGKQENEKCVDTGGHIMISYQWSDQAILKDVRDNMKACGFKVWMDIDQMGGSTLQAMAEAVEEADIFLMCMSSKYKNSLPCRAEAEYAYQKKKLIIPLKMEKGYSADGWLGFILGSKLFYEFSGKYPFEKKMAELLKELKVKKSQLNDFVDGEEIIKPSAITVTHSVPPVVQTRSPVSSMPSKTIHSISVSIETIDAIRKWTASDVTGWISKNKLSGCGVDKLTGGEIALLAHMRLESPEYFYKCLQDMLRVKDLLTMSKIVWALNDLSMSEHK